MAESQHDDLADALAKLASGDVAPSEHEPAGPIDPPLKVVQPASSRQAAPKPKPQPAAIASRPVRLAAPASPAATPTPPPQSRVTIRPVAPVLRQQRPMAPTLNIPDQPEVSGNESTALRGDNDEPVIIEDDDAMLMPAADAVVLPGAKKKLALARAKVASQKNLEFRRTMIPILLTCGVLMLAFASLKFVSGAESSLSVLPIWVPILLVIAGAIVLALAVVNMLMVKQQLAGN